MRSSFQYLLACLALIALVGACSNRGGRPRYDSGPPPPTDGGMMLPDSGPPPVRDGGRDGGPIVIRDGGPIVRDGGRDGGPIIRDGGRRDGGRDGGLVFPTDGGFGLDGSFGTCVIDTDCPPGECCYPGLGICIPFPICM